MTRLNRAVASLRVFGDDLDPDEITTQLGCPPSAAWARGDLLSEHGAVRIARTGGWRYEAPATEPADLDAQVASLLAHLSPDLEVWERLAETYAVDLFCGWFMHDLNEGLQISPDTLVALGQRRIVLNLDLYGHLSKH